MPLFHTMGIRILLGARCSTAAWFACRTIRPKRSCDWFPCERVTTLFLVPTMFHDVLRHPKFGAYDLGSLSRVGYAGMNMTPALIERCLEQLAPGAVRELLRVERDLYIQLLRPSRPQAWLRRSGRDEPDHSRRLA